MTPKFEVVDNYLPQNVFENIRELFYDVKNGIPWYFVNQVNYAQRGDSLDLYFHHTIYHTTINSAWYDHMSPLLDSFDMRSLIRIKMNCYPGNDTRKEHAMHVDHYFSHQAAVFSINDCDGYTKFEDGTIVESVANRIVFFDGSQPHCSTNCTDDQARFNINFNYL